MKTTLKMISMFLVLATATSAFAASPSGWVCQAERVGDDFKPWSPSGEGATLDEAKSSVMRSCEYNEDNQFVGKCRLGTCQSFFICAAKSDYRGNVYDARGFTLDEAKVNAVTLCENMAAINNYPIQTCKVTGACAK